MISVVDFFEQIASFADEAYGGDQDQVDFFVKQLGVPCGSVLELGIGTGRVGLEAADRGWQVIGVEPSAAMLAQAREKARQRGLSDRVRLVQCDALAFESAAKFPVVFSVGMFFHLPDITAYEAMLRHCHGLLEPGGMLLFDVECRGDGGWGDDGTLRFMGRQLDAEGGHIALYQASRAVSERQQQEGLFIIEATDKTGMVTSRRVIHQVSSWATLDQMKSLAERTSFSIEGAWGDYDGSPYSADSPEMILAFRRR